MKIQYLCQGPLYDYKNIIYEWNTISLPRAHFTGLQRYHI